MEAPDPAINGGLAGPPPASLGRTWRILSTVLEGTEGDTVSGFDIIGDVHGHADALEQMLRRLGYRERAGAHRQARRRAVFVGDLVDRGPGQVRVLEIVRRMVEAGSALMVMGNHELNAVAWATPKVLADGSDGWCREHSDKNRRQHQAFLDQVGEGSSAHRGWVEWFRTIPMWLDLGGVRVVHACWDPASMEVLGGPLLTDEAVTAGKGTPIDDAIEVVLKGPEVDLAGRCYLDGDGHHRDRARVRWWDPAATTLATAAEIPAGAQACDGGDFGPLPDDPVPPGIPSWSPGAPVLYGHYWRRGTPAIDAPTSACLDWSVARGGPLVAYRWSGEEGLTDTNLVAVG